VKTSHCQVLNIVFSHFCIFKRKDVLKISTLDKISEELKKQGKKQKDLTNYLGITKNAFSDWKGGRSFSYEKYIGKIADFLGVSTDYLLGKEKSPLSNDNGLSEAQLELIGLFDSAPPEIQAAALAVLKSAEARTQAQDADKANQ